MDLHQYNTPGYRRLYKQFVKDYVELDHKEIIEQRVRLLCELVYESNLGVSRYSCEGHPDDVWECYSYSGYVMFACRNRDAAQTLGTILQHASNRVITALGWEALPTIETSLASLCEDVSYPCLVIRSPNMTDETMADTFWDIITESTYNHLKHYIAVSPITRKAA